MVKNLLQKALLLLCCSTLSIPLLKSQTNPATPNILLIIADDLGIDNVNGYQPTSLLPSTPTLDSLRSVGITFDNAWAAPQCTPTRASIMSGKYGVKTGVTDAPGNLDTVHHSVFRSLDSVTNGAYADALIGKWHIGSTSTFDHPADHGVDYYDGVFDSQVSNYYSWDKVTNGVLVPTPETQYATSYFTDQAISWIKPQNQAWFMWLAHVAPHTPFHVPPANLITTTNTTGNRRQYLAAIEAMDTEIGRLLDSIPPAVLANTTVIFIGDNGTPNGVGRVYPSGQYKSTVYQGGVHVPMIVAGAGVSRQNVRESAMVHAVDIYATVLELAGASLPGGIHNSLSFNHLLTGSPGTDRTYNYSEVDENWTIRNDRYKLIEFADCEQEFYDLLNDTLEVNNLIGSLTAQQELIRQELESEATKIRGDWSCNDHIQNGTETAIDVCNQVCPPNTALSYTNIGCCANPTGANSYSESIVNNKRVISTIDFPSHRYCFNTNNIPSPIAYSFEVEQLPSLATNSTKVISACNRPDNYFGVALNGVLIAPAPATPFIFENPNTGEYNWDWVFEPTTNQGNGRNLVALDCASGHTGPQGYHYHGNMFEYAESVNPGISTTTTAPASPMQIGWAADGFPILYRFGPDGVGGLALLQPSYELKQGNRPGDGIVAPCGAHNGKYTNDYEYVLGMGDLDECNGIQRSVTLTTPQGQETFSYFYVVTDSFPQVSRCISGAPDATFDSQNNGTPVTLDLMSFEAEYRSETESVILNWFTANENNVAYFEVEKSTFSDEFKAIASLDVRSSPQGVAPDYGYEDLEVTEAIQYYRLKVVDQDGSYTYSETEIININGTNTGLSLTISPNPTKDHIELLFESHGSASYQVELFNVLGKMVFQLKEPVSPGTSVIKKNISMQGLPLGTYVMKVSNAHGVATQKIVKVD